MSELPVQPRLPLVDTLNALPRAAFAVAVRPLFESDGPLAEELYAGRPYASYAALIDRAEARAMALPREQQIDIVNAHPRIGANAASVRRQSSLSYREQGYDREAALPAADVERLYATLAELNHRYEARFGFRFVVFVNKRPRSEIVDVLTERLHNPPAVELETALHELFAIARDRLALLLARPAS